MEAAAERMATCLENRSTVNNCRGSTPPASSVNSDLAAFTLEPQIPPGTQIPGRRAHQVQDFSKSKEKVNYTLDLL